MRNISKSERITGFGLFRPFNNNDPENADMRKIIEEFVLKMENMKNIDFTYDLEGVISTMLYEMHKEAHGLKHAYKMNTKTEKIYYNIRKLVQEEMISSGNGSGYDSHFFDHNYWYKQIIKLGELKVPVEHYIFESHPYTTLDGNDFKVFVNIMDKYPFIKIEVRPDSYYFLGRTVFIRFIVNPEDKRFKQMMK